MTSRYYPSPVCARLGGLNRQQGMPLPSVVPTTFENFLKNSDSLLITHIETASAPGLIGFVGVQVLQAADARMLSAIVLERR